MSARAARRTRQPEVVANSHRHSNQLSREQLYRENERLLRENEELRRKVAERESQIAEHEKQIADADKQIADAEKQIADAEKQIADLERQLAGRKKNSTNSSKPPSSDGLAGEPGLPISAKGAGIAATGAQVSGMAKTVLMAGMSGAVFGPVLGIAGAWIGYRVGMNRANSDERRARRSDFYRECFTWMAASFMRIEI